MLSELHFGWESTSSLKKSGALAVALRFEVLGAMSGITKLTKKACHLCKGNLRLLMSGKNCNNPLKTKNKAEPDALPFYYNMMVHPGRDLIYFM